MSNASSPRQGGPSPSASSATQIRYAPYQKANGIQMMTQGVRPMMVAAGQSPMVSMTPNGQMVMAQQGGGTQMVLGNPIQARLGTPYMVGGGHPMAQAMGGGMVMVPNTQMAMSQAAMSQAAMSQAMTTGQMPQAGQIMMTPQGQMIQAPASGQIQVQYVQPPIAMPGQPQSHFQSQPVSYSQNAASNPPPPPQGNPPTQNDTQPQQAGSRSSTPQTKSEAGVKCANENFANSNHLGPDFNHENERLQNLVKELRAETAKLQKDKTKLRDKVKKLSRQNEGATKSYTVKDGKCPFCQQEMPAKNNRK